jgi:putative two-component system response regulator
VEAAADALVGVSPDGLITVWGAGAQRLFGYEPEEALGRRVSILAPSEDEREPYELIHEALAGTGVDRVETNRITKDGRRLRVVVSLSAVTDRDGRAAGIIGVYRDVTQQRDAEAARRQSEHRFGTIVEALSEGVVMMDRDGHVLASNQNAERLLELPTGALQDCFASGPSWSLLDEAGNELSPENYPSRVCLRTGRPQEGIVIGVQVAGEVRRWLAVNSSPIATAGAGGPEAVVASFTDVSAHRRTITELQTARLEDLERLALVGEYRDDDTFRHAERVGYSAEQIALELGLDKDVAWTIRRAAPLHDVGKIGIPDAILLKPAALTPEEFEVIKTHTTIGRRILGKSQAPVLRMAAEIAATHHERWDGTGYPVGLRGQGIPAVGRIAAIADAFDAITHTRPYKAASTIQEALAEIARCAGGQFDPEIVRAFARVDHSQLVDDHDAQISAWHGSVNGELADKACMSVRG